MAKARTYVPRMTSRTRSPDIPPRSHVDGQDQPARSRPAALALTALAALVCSAIVTQVFLAGLGLLVDPGYLAWHTGFVHLIELAVLVMAVVAVFTRRGLGLAGLSLVTLVLIGTQYALIHGVSGPWRALHAVNAFVLFGVSWTIARRAANLASTAAGTRASTGVGLAVLVLSGLSVFVAGTLPHGSAAGQSPATATDSTTVPEASPLGADVFAQTCSGCHGANGQGGVGPRLAGNDDLKDRSFVEKRVREGDGIMPAFDGRLSEEQIEAVVDHVRSSWGNGD